MKTIFPLVSDLVKFHIGIYINPQAVDKLKPLFSAQPDFWRARLGMLLGVNFLPKSKPYYTSYKIQCKRTQNFSFYQTLGSLDLGKATVPFVVPRIPEVPSESYKIFQEAIYVNGIYDTLALTKYNPEIAFKRTISSDNLNLFKDLMEKHSYFRESINNIDVILRDGAKKIAKYVFKDLHWEIPHVTSTRTIIDIFYKVDNLTLFKLLEPSLEWFYEHTIAIEELVDIYGSNRGPPGHLKIFKYLLEKHKGYIQNLLEYGPPLGNLTIYSPQALKILANMGLLEAVDIDEQFVFIFEETNYDQLFFKKTLQTYISYFGKEEIGKTLEGLFSEGQYEKVKAHIEKNFPGLL